MKRSPLLRSELRAISGLSTLYAIRMLGLFMILPVLTLYSEHLAHATPVLIGLALGAYGLTQALLQVPFGMLSDRIGRKSVIAVGLLLLLIGSIVAANATSIYGVILGRCLQGSGAVSGVIMALLADRTREEVRTSAMAVIGMSIGVSIGASMVIGPVLAHRFGLAGVFWSTALMAALGMLVLWRLIPKAPERSHKDVGMDMHQLRDVLARTDLLRLDLSIFALHAILTALFVVLPLKLISLGIASESHGWVYLPIMATAFVAMAPLIIIAEKRRKMRPIFIGTVMLLVPVLSGMFALPDHSRGLIALLWLFFVAFNLLEATLPSLVSKLAPAGGKGTALSLYSTSQFLGTTVGGSVGGLVAGAFGADAIFLFAALVALVWLGCIWGMPAPRHLSSEIVPLGQQRGDTQQLLERLLAIRGVADAMIVKEEGVAYLKVDRDHFDAESLEAALRPSAG
ncbi:MFS transporter [Halotalea alkalilenta]|uniref:MFS transporter n=1 Tax=Halotalea alkalilenta TaxID=376489 RepID=UPI00048727D5|nr:MFS transporter [Halotalea alkalilenta]